MNTIFLSVIIPAYKESGRIGSTLLSLENFFSDKNFSYEIIVVNDGSPDDTLAVANGYRKSIKNLKVVDTSINYGKGHAVKTGMLKASGEYRLFMDADNSVHISEIGKFFKEIAKGHEVVIGSIAVGDDNVVEHNGWYRRFLGSISKFFLRKLVTPGIYDTQRGFKLFTAEAAEEIFPRQTINRFGFDIELLVIAHSLGYSIKELAVNFDNPAGSTVRLSDYAKTLVELVGIMKNKMFGSYMDNPPARTFPGAAADILKNTLHILLLPLRFFFGPKAHVHMETFDDKTEAKKGKGFFYKNKEYVHHTELHNTETAFYNLVYVQKVALFGIAIILMAALFVNWHMTLVVLVATLTCVYFLDLFFNAFLIYRSFTSDPEIRLTSDEIKSLQDADLPKYTIFCPLYREWQVVPQFVKAMNDLDYPKEKLDIIFLLEENDEETIGKIRGETLPPHYRIIVVPHSNPKTKPKAMNYGLKYVDSTYLVIYDAEDVPERDQLKKAILAFQKSSKRTVCIQAKLNFYNVRQNILTRMFTSEYSLWFDLVLPGLQSFNAPIPLGGTSNHFKVSALRKLKGWDAFNVTEDCDLGIRLAKKGYRTAIVESTTYEEANSDVKNWYNQRSRWIKGYIQSYLVHMRDPQSFIETGSIKDFFIFQLTVGGKILSMFINPVMWIITICYFLFRAKTGLFIESFFPTPILYIGVFSLITGNFLYLYYYMVACAKRGFDDLIKYVFFVPIYWLGMSFAAWKAVYEIIIKPHYWSKTIHGLHLNLPKSKDDSGAFGSSAL